MTTFQEAFDQAEAEVESVEDVALDVDPALEGGQVEDEGTVSEDAAPAYFDLDAYGDQLVRIKVDGQERDVAVKDLPNGYMRQEAFTQKTQQLAAERQRLQAAETLAAAYERNPYETVQFLARQQGLTLAEAKAQAEAAVAEQEDSWANDAVDPRVAQLDARLAEIETREARVELEKHLADLGTRYGDLFNADEVVGKAIEYGTTDLEGVFKMMAFDRVMARQQAVQEHTQAQQSQETKTIQAKQQLAQIVASGESFAGAGDMGSAPITTVAAALEAAMAGSGFNFD